MGVVRFFLATTIFILATDAKAAQPNVVEVATLDDLKTCCGGASPPTNANVDGFAAPHDAGGGQFVAATCRQGDATDEGVIIKETVLPGRCWYRQFSGAVHLSWYGVKDATSPSCLSNFASCAVSQTIIQNAFAAAAPSTALGGDGGVVTDGRSIVINDFDLDIPGNQYFTCSGPPGGQRTQNADANTDPKLYYELPNSIALNPMHTIRREANALLHHCIIRPTWYTQSLYTGAGRITNTRGLIDQVEHSFAGTATQCGSDSGGNQIDGEACNMHDMLILGFDTCDDTRNSPRAVLANLILDCNVGEFIRDNGGGMELSNVVLRDVLEQVNVSGNSIRSITCPITGLNNSGGNVQVTYSTTPADCKIAAEDTVLITGLGNTASTFSSPSGLNGTFLVESAGTGVAVLSGSSWTGPSATAGWTKGANAITVADATNIAVGQYLCASGTAPFCSPPGDFGFATVQLIDNSLNSSSCLLLPPNVAVSGTNTPPIKYWPRTGLIQIGSEYLRYKIVKSDTLAIIQRGVDGTACAAHAMGSTVTAAAPTVVAVIPVSSTSKVVGVSALAQNTSAGQSVTFANDLNISGSGLGYVTLNAGYRTWTANSAAASEGATCSYPTGQPWKGNCPATGFLFISASGVFCSDLHAHAWRVYLHLKDSQNTVCNSPIFDSGHSGDVNIGGYNASQDPSAVGILIDGTADKIEIANGKLDSWNGIVNLPTSQGNALGLVNLNVAQTTVLLVNGPNGKIAISNLKGSDAETTVTYLDPAMDSLSMAASRMTGSNYYFADPAALNHQYCDRSTHFGSGECGQSLGSLTCITGCGMTGGVTGSDDRFDITTNGTSTSVALQLAGIYDTVPLCTATTSGTTGGVQNGVSIIGTDVQPYWTQVTFKLASATSHIYGSCH